jgi:hypothetical protein
MDADVAKLILRFLIAGPLLYIGLCMAVDPSGFARTLACFVRELNEFEARLLGYRDRQVWAEPVLDGLSRSARWGFRLGGWAVCAAALVHLIGLVH